MATVKKPRKPRTNEQQLYAFLKSCNTFEIMLVVERLNKILKSTMDDIRDNPEEWRKCVVSPSAFERIVEKAKEHLDYDTWTKNYPK